MITPSDVTTLNRIVTTDNEGLADFRTFIHAASPEGFYRFIFQSGEFEQKVSIYVKRQKEGEVRLAYLETVPSYMNDFDTNETCGYIFNLNTGKTDALMAYGCPDSDHRQVEIWQNGRLNYYADLNLEGLTGNIIFPLSSPVGNYQTTCNGWCGVFEGNGHVLSHFTPAANYLGLFGGKLNSSGVVQNLSIVDVKLNKTVNDTIKLNGETFEIVGIFETGNTFQDQGGFSPLEITQDLMDAEDNISSIYVKLDSGANVETVEGKIDSLYGENLTTISSLSDLEMVRDMIDMLNGASWAISLLAIIIGGVGIINTMLTSVLERTRELGVLKAVGWSNRKILIMIIGESIVITLVAGIIGSICGVIGVELLSATGAVSILAPVYTINTFVKAFGIALIVGVVGLSIGFAAFTQTLRIENVPTTGDGSSGSCLP